MLTAHAPLALIKCNCCPLTASASPAQPIPTNAPLKPMRLTSVLLVFTWTSLFAPLASPTFRYALIPTWLLPVSLAFSWIATICAVIWCAEPSLLVAPPPLKLPPASMGIIWWTATLQVQNVCNVPVVWMQWLASTRPPSSAASLDTPTCQDNASNATVPRLPHVTLALRFLQLANKAFISLEIIVKPATMVFRPALDLTIIRPLHASLDSLFRTESARSVQLKTV